MMMMISLTYFLEWQLAGELLSHHDHPGDPEKHDVAGCFEQIGRIKPLQVRSLGKYNLRKLKSTNNKPNNFV